MRGGQASAAKAKTSPSRATGFLLIGAKRGPVTGAAPALPLVAPSNLVLSHRVNSPARSEFRPWDGTGVGLA